MCLDQELKCCIVHDCSIRKPRQSHHFWEVLCDHRWQKPGYMMVYVIWSGKGGMLHWIWKFPPQTSASPSLWEVLCAHHGLQKPGYMSFCQVKVECRIVLFQPFHKPQQHHHFWEGLCDLCLQKPGYMWYRAAKVACRIVCHSCLCKQQLPHGKNPSFGDSNESITGFHFAAVKYDACIVLDSGKVKPRDGLVGYHMSLAFLLLPRLGFTMTLPSGMSWYSRSMDLLDISGCHFSTESSCNCVVTDPIWAWTEKYCVIPACGNVGVCSSVIWRGIRRNPWARLPLAPQLSRHFWGSYTVCIPPHETRVIICHSFRQRWNIALSKTIHSASHSHTITSEKYRVMRACRNHWQEGSSFWDPDHQSKGPNDWAKMARKFNL